MPCMLPAFDKEICKDKKILNSKFAEMQAASASSSYS